MKVAIHSDETNVNRRGHNQDGSEEGLEFAQVVRESPRLIDVSVDVEWHDDDVEGHVG